MKILSDVAYERETVLNFCDAEPGMLNVWTSQRRIGEWLEKVTKSLGIQVARTSRPTWEAQVPIKLLSLKKSVRKPLSEEQRAKLAERLAKGRAKKGGVSDA